MGDRLKGKIAIVTGAASGVGKADALLFAAEGARVVLTDVNEEAGHAVAAQIGDAALFVRHDIASEAGWNDVFGTTQKHFGTPGVLVNNAAILQLGSIEDATLEQWQRIMRINAEGYFLGCQAAVRAMKEKGGAIVNMSSVAALGGLGAFCAYSASKGAVTALTRAIAAHCKTQGYKVRANTIHPDGILTPMTEPFFGSAEAGRAQLTESVDPRSRMCLPEDIAQLVLFLASDASRFINGSEYRIDNAQMIMGVA
ncbi:SDR family oxidoreductase [Paraburkholderia sp. Ac-20340]|uniref:SDR family oxidoreductase n=1 Tax=Paraburkholderia sp. Ac-20340 TaxID=2703888 RepID=UPI00197EE923|nr:SDR family oxidoreductase [Paraburkholderia sp. Ac-20340]MBN3857179.1 SDR family oxidoreductase [Paraburkholderia sp. Ac-20340]